MRTRATWLCLVSILWYASPALAQRVEVGAVFGWALSDGVEGDTAVIAGDGNVYDAIDTKDSSSWGLSAGAHVNERFEVGFLFMQQMSTLRADGTNTLDIGDLDVTTYHPYIGFNFGAVDARIRPYAMIGFGATHFSSVSFTGITGIARETGSETQFSTTWGAGVKVYPSQHFGVRAGVQWTPTYIKTDSEGWWCDPYWGCYVVGDPQYANQLHFSGGVTARF
jgi:opacity protein-like surface antigen